MPALPVWKPLLTDLISVCWLCFQCLGNALLKFPNNYVCVVGGGNCCVLLALVSLCLHGRKYEKQRVQARLLLFTVLFDFDLSCAEVQVYFLVF